MLPALPFTFAVLLSLALSASAGIIKQSTSPVTLALTRHFNLTGASKILEIDQARARWLKGRTKASESRSQGPYSLSVTNQATYYSTIVGIGTPPKNFSLLIDTGSSNTWVGAQPTKPFIPSSSKPTGEAVIVMYGSGQFFGAEYTDTVHLGNIAIANQGFGGAILANGFGDGIDGILGIGPVDLTQGSLPSNRSKAIPTVTDNAFTQGLISAHEIGISFAPTTALEVTNGMLTFGGIDFSRINGPLTYIPITAKRPAGYYVGIDQTIAYGDADNVILASTAGITDTGTTLLLIATDAFQKYQTLTGAVMDNNTGLLRLTPAQFGNLRSLLFTIGGTVFEFTPNAQAWPRALNTVIGGSNDYVYLITADLGSNSGEGLDFINGKAFLERFYQVYDIANNRVGLATTHNTYALTN